MDRVMPQSKLPEHYAIRALAPIVLPFTIVFPLMMGSVRGGNPVLKPETVDAWDRYIEAASVKTRQRETPGVRFLSLDESSERQLRQGEVLVAPAGPRIPCKVPSGLIHDWVGTAFIPNATLDDVLRVSRDYTHYKDIYKPVVIESSALHVGPAEDVFSLRLMNKSLISKTALDTTYQSSIRRLSATRASAVTQSTRIEEIENFGSPNAQKLPADQGSGLLWRLYSVTRYEERDGGVYVEIEAIALSRDIPFSLRWMVEPIVRRVSRSSLSTSLEQTKDAVHSLSAHHSDAESRRAVLR
jgi:hypothetical protein